MSVRTSSAGVDCNKSSASRPCCASPTIDNGNAPMQSSSSSRRRRRAGASSSTIKTRSAVSPTYHLRSGNTARPQRRSQSMRAVARLRYVSRRFLRACRDFRLLRSIRHANMHFVAFLRRARFEARFGIKMQGESFADVVERHLVAGLMTAPAQKNRIPQDRMNLALRQKEVDRNRARLARWLDPVVHGILEQRLQHQRRDERIARHTLDVPVDDQPIAEPQLLEVEVLPA